MALGPTVAGCFGVSGFFSAVFGGSGFVGRHVVRALARQGWRIRAACRRPDLAGHLQPMGNVGQIMPVQANVRFPESITRAIEGADAVVICVGGGLAPSGKQTFDALMAAGPRAIAKAVGKPHLRPQVSGRSRAGDIRHCFADLARARTLLDFEPKADFDKGLIELADWLKGRVAIDRVDQATAELKRWGLVA